MELFKRIKIIGMGNFAIVNNDGLFKDEVLDKAKELAANNEQSGPLNPDKYDGLTVFLCEPDEEVDNVIMALDGAEELKGKKIVVGGKD